MYETAFGFHRHPFRAFDPRRPYFVTDCVRRLLPQFLHALRTDLGVAVLTGPSGIGKSALLRHLRTVLAGESRVLLCSAAAMDSPASLWELLSSTPSLPKGSVPNATGAGAKGSVPVSGGETKGSVPGAGGMGVASVSVLGSRWGVVERLQKSAELWGPLLLLIDDAHLLPIPVLHDLRALLEESGPSGQLVRGLISGPLSLEEEFARPSHSDFSGLIRCHGFLQPLTSSESVQYLDAVISSVGRELGDVLESGAIDLIVQAADGNPRSLNLLTDEVFVVGHESGMQRIQAPHVLAALTRLRHLPHTWNAPAGSLLDDLVSTSDASPNFRTGTVFSSDGHSGIVEFGSSLSGSLESASDSVPASTPAPKPTPAPIEDLLPPEPPSWLESSVVDEFGYEFPDPLLSTEPLTPPELSSQAEPSRHTEPPKLTEERKSPELTDCDWPAIHDVPERTQGEGFMVPCPPSIALELGSLEASNRLPVFDRYTWVEFQREVPPGDRSILTSRMRSWQESEASSLTGRFLPLTADQVPLYTVTEDNFDAWLNESRPAEEEAAEEETSDADERFFLSMPASLNESNSESEKVSVLETNRSLESGFESDMNCSTQDEVVPLAQSVARLHEEVHAFHSGTTAGSSNDCLPEQTYVVGSLLREALGRVEPLPSTAVPVKQNEPAPHQHQPESAATAEDETSRPTRFSNLFTSLRSLRRIDSP